MSDVLRLLRGLRSALADVLAVEIWYRPWPPGVRLRNPKNRERIGA